MKDNSLQQLVFSYGAEDPLKLEGQWTAYTSFKNKGLELTFVVVEGNYPCLLGKVACENLGLVTFHPNYVCFNTGERKNGNVVTMDPELDKIVGKHANLFKGLGKLKNYELRVEVNPNVRPIAQPIRRLPFHIRHKVEQEIERLIALDILERVDGPTPWLSGIVVVPKLGGTVRICVDMRCPNESIVSHKYPIPLVDDVIQKLEGATCITELDFNEAYHQLSLANESRVLTTSATETEKGIFGMNIAAEVFQYQIREVLKDCEGVENISDNTIVYGKDVIE